MVLTAISAKVPQRDTDAAVRAEEFMVVSKWHLVTRLLGLGLDAGLPVQAGEGLLTGLIVTAEKDQ
jgi:hypothetical protein